MFAELRFFAPEMGIKSPTEARGWCSTKLAALPPEFYNRAPDGKGFLPGASAFTIRPDHGGVAIDAFGPAATTRLLSLAIEVQSQFISHYPDGQMSFHTGNAGLSVSDRLQAYEVQDFVIQNSSAHLHIFAEWKQSPDAAKITGVAKDLFLRKLDERCALLDTEIPEDAVFGDFVATPTRPVYAGNMPKFAVNLAFRTNVVFTGPWLLGRLAGKSSGRVQRTYRPAASRKKEDTAK